MGTISTGDDDRRYEAGVVQLPASSWPQSGSMRRSCSWCAACSNGDENLENSIDELIVAEQVGVLRAAGWGTVEVPQMVAAHRLVQLT